MTRPLYEIASEIIGDWPKANNTYHPAGAYLIPMLSLNSIQDKYGWDDGKSIVRYFLSNATTWRGDSARRIKAELKSML